MVQDVVDVHEVQEDLMQRSMSSMSKGMGDAAKAQGLPTDLDSIREEYGGVSQLHGEENIGDSGECPPTLATQLPCEADEDNESTNSAPASKVITSSIPVENLEDVSTDDWGLDMLVRVGESWAPNLLLMTAYVLPRLFWSPLKR